MRPLPAPAPSAHFGEGRAEPYEHALRAGSGLLRMLPTDPAVEEVEFDVARFATRADADDLDALGRTTGPVLDVGCGPGRIVRAAIGARRTTLGIDVSSAAVTLAAGEGLPVLHRSVFDPLPAAGRWGAVVLLDGNIGIGGDPSVLLHRCRELVRPQGSVLVELHPTTGRDVSFAAVLADAAGRSSGPFRWAEVGLQGLGRHAEDVGLDLNGSWSTGARRFAVLARR